MKKVNISVGFDDEKLTAMKIYLEANGKHVEEEFEKLLDGLYKRVVPAQVREYLSIKMGETEKHATENA